MVKVNRTFKRKKYNLNAAAVWGITAGVCGLVFLSAFVLFTDTTVSVILTAASLLPVYSKVRKECEKAYERTVRREFVSCLVTLSGTLSSGARLEQCVNEIALGDSSEIRHIRPEFQRMAKLIQLNLPVEKAFSEFAERVPVSDIKLFSQALEYGIPAGVNLIDRVRSFPAGMRIRNDVEAEITRTLNLPKYNNRVVTVMPFVMIAVMRLTAGDYLAGLDTGAGLTVKAVSAGLIVIALVLGELLGDIRYAE
jgi:tight adherence protein B